MALSLEELWKQRTGLAKIPEDVRVEWASRVSPLMGGAEWMAADAANEIVTNWLLRNMAKRTVRLGEAMDDMGKKIDALAGGAKNADQGAELSMALAETRKSRAEIAETAGRLESAAKSLSGDAARLAGACENARAAGERLGALESELARLRKGKWIFAGCAALVLVAAMFMSASIGWQARGWWADGARIEQPGNRR